MLTAKIKWAIVVGTLACCALLVQAQQPRGFKLPPMNFAENPDYYPNSALRRSVQGRVLLDFTISRRNRIDDVTIVESEPQTIFESAAKRALSDVKFKVPDNWEDSGGSKHHFTLSFVFKIYPCPTTPCFDVQPHANADDFFIITGMTKN